MYKRPIFTPPVLHSKLGGRFKLETFGPNRELRRSTGWFRNLITDYGMERYVSQSSNTTVRYWCHVGTGSAAPAFTDTALDQWTAVTGTSVRNESTASIASGNPRWIGYQNTYQFAPGFAGGNVNISEIGLGSNDTNINLRHRALVLDQFEQPTTISVLSDEYLEVTFELRFYSYMDDVVGQITLDGSVYDYIIRPSNHDAFDGSGPGGFSGWINNISATSGPALRIFPTSTTICRVYDGTIGSIDASTPSGSTLSCTTTSGTSQSCTYDGGLSFTNTTNLFIPVNQGNLAGGIRSLATRSGAYSSQIQFTPAIPKTADYILSFSWKQAYARRTI